MRYAKDNKKFEIDDFSWINGFFLFTFIVNIGLIFTKENNKYLFNYIPRYIPILIFFIILELVYIFGFVKKIKKEKNENLLLYTLVGKFISGGFASVILLSIIGWLFIIELIVNNFKTTLYIIGTILIISVLLYLWVKTNMIIAKKANKRGKIK